MTRIFTIAGGIALVAGSALAQATEVGPSGNAAYPVEVAAADGTRYFCRAENVILDGRTVRPCIRARAAGGDPFGGGGGTGALIAAGVALGLVGLAVNSTDTTN